MVNVSESEMTVEDRRELVQNLGIGGATTDENLSLTEIKAAIDAQTDPEFASMGEAIRSDLSGKLDADLIDEVVIDPPRGGDEFAVQLFGFGFTCRNPRFSDLGDPPDLSL